MTAILLDDRPGAADSLLDGNRRVEDRQTLSRIRLQKPCLQSGQKSTGI